MKDKKYFEDAIAECRKTQERLRMDFERQEGVIRFCQYTIERIERDEKETEKTALLNK